MKRVGFLLKVKADKLEEYKKHHETVWPEMLEALRRTGWHNYSIFAREDGLLFGYFETPDSFQAALDGMANEDINASGRTSWRPILRISAARMPMRAWSSWKKFFIWTDIVIASRKGEAISDR